MTKNIILCALMAMSLTQNVDAFPTGSRCEPNAQMAPMAVVAIYGSKRAQQDPSLFRQTYGQSEKNKPLETARYCQSDNMGNKLA